MQRRCQDHGIRPDMSLPPAERAVKYLLDVLPYHPNLAWYLSPGTEMLTLLLTAEAARQGEHYDNMSCAFARTYFSMLKPEIPCRGLRVSCPKCGEPLTTCPQCGESVQQDRWEVE